MNKIKCRFCGYLLKHVFVDLGISPVANAMLSADMADAAETLYPLRVYICKSCKLVQLPNAVAREQIFNNHYTYFSGYSTLWLKHAKAYADMAEKRFTLSKKSFVVELASNDGYLLQYFVEKSIPVMGVDPSANVAAEAKKKKVPTLVEFFGRKSALRMVKNGQRADLVIANNVLAHVPDINDFVAGIKKILKPDGVVTAEFPHLVNLIEKNQFDTIYHEHYSYYIFSVIEAIFARHGLAIFDVEELPTHGGSLRIYGAHQSSVTKISDSVARLKKREKDGGYFELKTYYNYGEKVKKTKRDFLKFVIGLKEKGKSIVAYGAAAKGNTFLNYCGVRTDYIDYAVDKSPHKQNKLLPGTRIPVCSPDKIKKSKPDYILILPWNLRQEIIADLAYVSRWGGKCFTAVPEIKITKI